MSRRVIFRVLLGLCLFGTWTAGATRAPENGRFHDWRETGATGGGLVPSPVDRSHLAESYRRLNLSDRPTGRQRLRTASPIPARWDSREQGVVTPVRDQGTYGTCWAFATCAALETGFLVGSDGVVTNDFSENHLARHDVGFAWGFKDGGNNDMAQALVLAWRDPLYEKDDPYPKRLSTVELPPVCHVQESVVLPERTTVSHVSSEEEIREANAELQRAVMRYGALAVGYLHCSNHYRGSTGAHYLNDDAYVPSSSDGGHAVTLIGWDDAYPTNNFRAGRCPPGPGAFLCKNSWGPTAGDAGYLWISYYDDSFGMMSSVAYPEPEATDNYGRIYQYDPCGFTTSYNVLESGERDPASVTNWCANVFMSVATGIVEAVGFHALSAGTTYELRAYAGCRTDPSSGELVSVQTGLVDHAGFTTVRLATPVNVGMGEKFAVALGLSCPGTDYPLPVERSEDDYCTATANAGESYFSRDGKRWTDFQHFEPTGNFCVKAYTRQGADGPVRAALIESVEPASEDGPVRLWAGDAAAFSVATVADVGACTYSWTLDAAALGEDSDKLLFVPGRDDHGVHELVCRVTAGDRVDWRTWSLVVNAELRSADYPSLQAAVNDAIDGDVVLVAPGTYPALTAPSALLDIVSEEGPDVTVLARGPEDTCCYNGYYNPNTLLAGFTLRDGNCQTGGGARYGWLANCVITNCLANYGGGACECVLDSCLVVDCQADYGGGTYDCDVYNGTILRNGARSAGGGVFLGESGFTVNSIVTGNSCRRSLASGSDYYDHYGYLPTQTFVGGDPLFVDFEHGDYRLSAKSPLIDCGLNDAVTWPCDLDGTNRIFGATVDLGCYEYCHVPQGWPTPSVRPGASEAEESEGVTAAMVSMGFPQETATKVTTMGEYCRIAAWSEKAGVTPEEHAAASTAVLSVALDAAGLLKLTPDNLSVSAMDLSTNGQGRVAVSLLLPFAGYDVNRVDARLLTAAVDVLGSERADGEYQSDGLSVSVEPRIEGVGLVVTPPPGASAYFLRTRVR